MYQLFIAMKWLLIVFAACVVSSAVPGNGPSGLTPPLPYDYHRRVGAPLAASVQAGEAVDASSRIFNGAPAQLGQFPYFGGLVILLSSGGASACGSGLVTATRLLTAAHCWYDGFSQAVRFTVVLGSTTLFTGGLRIDTSSVEMHSGWDPVGWTLADDIAVINVPAVSFNALVSPVSLPDGSSDFAGSSAVIPGIGMTGQWSPITPEQIVSFAELPVLSNAECARTFGFLVTQQHVCTGSEEGRNICTGDSGGPVVVSGQLVGLVSFGNGGGAGCEAGLPAAHTRVSSYLDWIQARL